MAVFWLVDAWGQRRPATGLSNSNHHSLQPNYEKKKPNKKKHLWRHHTTNIVADWIQGYFSFQPRTEYWGNLHKLIKIDQLRKDWKKTWPGEMSLILGSFTPAWGVAWSIHLKTLFLDAAMSWLYLNGPHGYRISIQKGDFGLWWNRTFAPRMYSNCNDIFFTVKYFYFKWEIVTLFCKIEAVPNFFCVWGGNIFPSKMCKWRCAPFILSSYFFPPIYYSFIRHVNTFISLDQYSLLWQTLMFDPFAHF